MAENEETIKDLLISGIISSVQLQMDLYETALGMHDLDSDDEETLVVLAGHNDLLSVEGDESEEECENAAIDGAGSASPNKSKKGGKRGAESDENEIKKANNLGYFEITIPLYTGEEFRHYFHISRPTCELLFQKLVPILQASTDLAHRSGRPPIPMQKKILIVLWFFATQQPFRLISERFEVSKASVEDGYRRVSAALVKMAADYVRWPSRGEAAEAARAFRRGTGLTDLLGVVGAARFRIKTAKAAPEAYADPILDCPTVTCLFTCDHNLRFIDCFPGLPGSFSDVMLLRNSNLDAHFPANLDASFSENMYLVGGPSFPIEPWLMTPFVDEGRLHPSKRAFNDAVSAALVTRHRAVALLQGRFPRLKKTLGIGRLDYLPNCIHAAFVLHNVCLDEDPDEMDNVQEFVDAGWETAVAEYNLSVDRRLGNLDEGADPDRWLKGCERRNALCKTLDFVPGQ